jgi:O-acetyl-ADP-ribose deacetylase (regulator of RNase III)
VKTYRRRHIVSVAFPPLGCGHGGLKWDQVEPLMRRYLEKLTDIEIYFCFGQASTSEAIVQFPQSGEKTSADCVQRNLWE